LEIQRRKLSELELLLIVEEEIRQATSHYNSEVSQEREESMERYLGEPMGNEIEGRSTVVSRDILETIEWIMPTLMEIFVSGNAVEFEPTHQDDVQQAKQESDYLNYVFYKKNPGFLIAYTWFKDALLSKTGTVKVYAEENEEVKKEEYHNLLDIELHALVADDDVEIIEKTEHKESIQLDDSGQLYDVTLYDVKISYKEQDVEECIENLAPEEHLISNDAKDINPSKARFNCHQTTKTISEVREMGYSDDDIKKMEIGENPVEFSAERLARLNLAGEERWDDSATLNTGMRPVKVYECYLYVDMDGDGSTELLKIFKSGDFIDYEEIDYHPVHSITPIILTHKYYGLSVADLLKDIQEIRTTLFRSYLDNIYQTINGKTYYDLNKVNVDDMLTNLPYGLVEVDGAPGDSVFVDRPGGLPPESFTLNELLDKVTSDRIGEFRSQLDPNVLAQANTGVVLEMLNEAKGKVFMIARIFAETGFKSLFLTLHHLARKYSNKEEVVQLNDKWVPVNPAEWRERKNLSVRVGLGHKTTKEEIAYYGQLVDMQKGFIEMGVPVVTPQNVYDTLVNMTEAMGKSSEVHWTPPDQIPPPPPQSDPNIEIMKLTAQVEEGKIQQKREESALKSRVEELKLQLQAAQLQQKAQEAQSQSEIEKLKLELASMKEINSDDRSRIETAIKERTAQLEHQTNMVSNEISANSDQIRMMLDKYKTDLDAEVRLMVEQIKKETATMNSPAVQQMIVQLMDQVHGLEGKLESDMDIEYDDTGRISRVGKKVIKRDANGRATGISRTQ